MIVPESYRQNSSVIPGTDVAERFHGSRSPGHRRAEPAPDNYNLLDTSSRLMAERKMGRSQTAVPFRPSKAIPLRRSKTTSVKLDALEQAYRVVTNEASPIPVEDLLQATRLVHRIGAALAEQMSKTLGDIT